MKTKIKTELAKSITSDDMVEFREELMEKLNSRLMKLSAADLWPVFQKAAGNIDVEWDSLTETPYDETIDYSALTRRFKSLVVDHFVDDIVGFIRKRRGSKRFDFKKEVDVYPVESMAVQPFLARSENISAGGMLIRSERSFNRGDRLELRVRDREAAEPVRIFGSVVRAEKSLPSVFDIGVYINCISEHGGQCERSTASTVYRMSQGE